MLTASYGEGVGTQAKVPRDDGGPWRACRACHVPHKQGQSVGFGDAPRKWSRTVANE